MNAPRKPLRVLSCLHNLEPGGVERVVLRLTKAWRENGVDARIALGRAGGALQEEAPDVPFFIMQTERATPRRFETLWTIWKLPSVIRTFRPDVLFCGSNGLAIVGFAMRLRLGRTCPPIVLKISQDLLRPDMSAFALRIDRYALRLHAWVYARVIAIAEPAKAQIVSEMGLPSERVAVINNASMTMADLERYETARDQALSDAKSSRRSGRHFIGVGRLMPQKNFELLVEAFARIARPDDQLTVLGEGPRRAAIEALVEARGLAHQVHLPGYQFATESWFADADAFILSSDFEGIGNVVLEALAAGLPVVATHCCAPMPMLIKDVGTLVPIQDVVALANAMNTIGDLRFDPGIARARAAQFTTEATTDKWIALFESIVR